MKIALLIGLVVCGGALHLRLRTGFGRVLLWTVLALIASFFFRGGRVLVPPLVCVLSLEGIYWTALPRSKDPDRGQGPIVSVSAEDRRDDRIHTWPHLVRIEFLCALLMMLLLMVWAVGVDAPLEAPANPTITPNPSKAPWYFLGLQEMLVFFDPWHAGVVLPSLIIIGLMMIPYIDINPSGNGYYCFAPRKYEILTYFLGFHVLWISLIVIGTFLRGPGWNWFWVWEPWDPHKVEAMANVNLPYLLGCRSDACSFAVGGGITIGFFAVGTVLFYLWVKRIKGLDFIRRWGWPRFGVTAFLLLNMAAVVAKMLLRHLLAVKYIWVIQTSWFSINI